MVGTAYRGWSYEEVSKAGTYTWARIGGDLHHCLWISQSSATGAPGRPVSGSCPPAQKVPLAVFISTFTDGRTWSNAKGNDGRPARLSPHGDCAVHNGTVDGWGNVQPWLTRSVPSHQLVGALTIGRDGVRTVGKNQVLVRYASRDGRYVMVRAARYGKNDGDGHQSWFFVQSSCLQLPKADQQR
ncbi:hypothetical protein [Frankia sp. R82]|uniref:hypothetical protein n=1 Tax=Frankia sp. R82 TaxID=2950553 RepID=UPI002043F163|nr:hypothetical protein [Frankia sp. R82]MCM3886039.1 hypothetical protein [Frankia sp. R82]